MKPVIVRRIQRPKPETVRLLGGLGVATVHEAQGRSGLLQPYMRPIYPGARLAATAVTVYCQAGDNLMIHAALDVVERGDALVVVTSSESTHGMFGELLAESCLAHGVQGLVIDAGVRDTTELTAIQFPVWSKAISAQGTAKAGAGSVNVPVTCAGAYVNPGDVVIGDQDGVVVVPRLRAEEVAMLGEQRREKEARMRECFRAGQLGLDLYDLRAKLTELGVEYVEAEGA
jgi:4-hydroxy-4-methyl-2-oxoglutarate aldolase